MTKLDFLLLIWIWPTDQLILKATMNVFYIHRLWSKFTDMLIIFFGRHASVYLRRKYFPCFVDHTFIILETWFKWVNWRNSNIFHIGFRFFFRFFMFFLFFSLLYLSSRLIIEWRSKVNEWRRAFMSRE